MTSQTIDKKPKYEDGQKYCIENSDEICLAIAGPGDGKNICNSTQN